MLRGKRYLTVIVVGIAISVAVTIPEGSASSAVSSTEVRWFVEGLLPESVRSWFESAGRLGAAISQPEHEERSDLYLILAGNSSLGLKLRGRALELKYRESDAAVMFGPAGVQGRVEVWRKWEWQHAESGSQVIEAFQGAGAKGERLLVRKVRRQRKFELSEAKVSPVRSDQRLMSGCLAEVTVLDATGRKWWTVAVETFGTSDQRSVRQCAAWILSDYPGETLSLAQSYSYPGWLVKLGSP